MKLLFTFSFLLLSLLSFGQEYCFPLYFEDAAGNKDTVYFGEDSSASFWIDEQLGEVNLLNQPIDTIFEVFFTDAAFDACYFDFDQIPTFVSKKQFVSLSKLYDWYELGMIARNWPVTISWNQKEMENYVAQKGWSDCNLFLYSWNPPESVMGDVHCCGNWPNDYTLLNDTSRVVVDKSNFCHYAAPLISKDSINLFFIQYASFTGTDEITTGDITCRYGSKEKEIIIDNNSDAKLSTIEVFDIQGRKRLTKCIESDQCNNLEIEANTLSKGTYVVVISFAGKNLSQKKQKIVIQ
jgi:hypothetical protein